jgi:hypothetical protein
MLQRKKPSMLSTTQQRKKPSCMESPWPTQHLVTIPRDSSPAKVPLTLAGHAIASLRPPLQDRAVANHALCKSFPENGFFALHLRRGRARPLSA